MKAETFWEIKQEILSDAVSKHEDSYDKLTYYIENELNLTEDQYEKVSKLMEKVYSTLGDIKLEI